MKDKLIENHLTTRVKIDKVAVKLNINSVGSRIDIVNKIKECSYSAIKNAINEA